MPENLQGTQRSAGYLVGKHRRATEFRDEWYFQNLKQQDKYSKFAFLFRSGKWLKQVLFFTITQFGLQAEGGIFLNE